MFNLRRILFVLLLILSIIIVLEAVIYFFNPATSQRPNTLLPTPTQFNVMSPTAPQQNVALNPTLLDGILTSSKDIKKDLLKSFVVNVEMAGKIKELEVFKNGDGGDNGNKFFRMVLEGNQGGTHLLEMPKNPGETHVLKVFDENNSPINLSDLKVGDMVDFKIAMDITHSQPDDFNLMYQWQFTKIKQ